MKKLVPAVAFLLVAATAQAEPYVEARGLIANLDSPSGNIGSALAGGYDFGLFRLEAVAMHHMHLSDATVAALVMGYIDFGDGYIAPYIGIGAGSTIENREFDRPVIQGSIGVAVNLTDGFAITAGYAHRSYFNRVSEITSDNFGDSEDGTALIGMRAKF